MTEYLDFKKSFKTLYTPKNSEFELIEVPSIRFLSINGSGSPESKEFSESIQALYATAYPLKFISKEATGQDYAIPPLEALWWAEDYSSFTLNDRNVWKWTLLSAIPGWVTEEHYISAVAKAVTKRNERAKQIEIREEAEGLSYQALYTGPFSGKVQCWRNFTMKSCLQTDIPSTAFIMRFTSVTCAELIH